MSAATSSRIDLWHFSLDGPAEPALAFLDGPERSRFRRFATARLAAAFALRRAARRILLADRTGIEPAAIEIVEDGRPRLAGGGPAFSASHSDSLGTLAIAPCPVGTDVERQRDIAGAALADRVLSAEERRHFTLLADDARRDALFRLWCGKEALLKAIGVGLDLQALPQLTLPVEPVAGWSVARLSGGMARHGAWQVCWPDLGPGWTAAVVATTPLAVRVRDARPVLARHGLVVRQPAP